MLEVVSGEVIEGASTTVASIPLSLELDDDDPVAVAVLESEPEADEPATVDSVEEGPVSPGLATFASTGTAAGVATTSAASTTIGSAVGTGTGTETDSGSLTTTGAGAGAGLGKANILARSLAHHGYSSCKNSSNAQSLQILDTSFGFGRDVEWE